MRASKDIENWTLLCELTFRPGWNEDPKTVEMVQKLATKFGGSTKAKKIKKEVVVVFEGKETVYNSVAEAARAIPVHHITIHRNLQTGKTTQNGYSFYPQHKNMITEV